MSLGLSASQVAQLQGVLETLLSPLNFERVGAWRRQARQTLGVLLGAATSVSLLSVPGEPTCEADDPEPLVEYGAYYYRFDKVNRYRDLGTVAFTWDTIGHLWERPDRAAWLRGELYNDWVCRHRLHQPHGLNVALPPGQPHLGPAQAEGLAALYFFRDAAHPPIDAGRQLELMRVVLPAFIAGSHMLVRFARARDAVERVVRTLPEGVALFDDTGRVSYQNPALHRLLHEEPEAARLRAECARVGRFVLALGVRGNGKSRPDEVIEPAARELRTAAGRYRIRGALLGPGVLGSRPLALVMLERAVPAELTPAELGERYCLTGRETVVSRLLAAGHSNAEVAQLLGVSIHTARRHVEHVLTKLGVHSRAAVGAKLREG